MPTARRLNRWCSQRVSGHVLTTPPEPVTDVPQECVRIRELRPWVGSRTSDEGTLAPQRGENVATIEPDDDGSRPAETTRETVDGF